VRVEESGEEAEKEKSSMKEGEGGDTERRDPKSSTKKYCSGGHCEHIGGGDFRPAEKGLYNYN